jgi:hypothetical protein
MRDKEHQFAIGGLAVVTPGDDVLGVGDHRSVIQENVDVLLRRQESADVALQDEVGAVSELDRLRDLSIGGVDQVSDLAADALLPGGEGVDVGVDAGITGLRHRYCSGIADMSMWMNDHWRPSRSRNPRMDMKP